MAPNTIFMAPYTILSLKLAMVKGHFLTYMILNHFVMKHAMLFLPWSHERYLHQ
jgi:hypothetical protein